MPMKKETYELRKAQGLCVRCGARPVVQNQTMCQPCKEGRTYYRRKESGLCPTCGAAPSSGKTYCQNCIDKQVAEQEWYRAHGICLRCHQADALEGMTLCYACNEKNVLRCRDYISRLTPVQLESRKDYARVWKSARHDAGLCIQCGRPLVDRRFRLCGGCRAYHRNMKREISTAPNYARLGKCRRCGGELVEGYAFCAKHLEEARQLAARNFRPFGKPAADISYWRRLNNTVFTVRKNPMAVQPLEVKI